MVNAAGNVKANRIPLWVKVAYTAFVAVLVPVYWDSYGPTNFLYFCDVALLMAVPGLWLENALLLSAPAVGITIPQAVWIVDFLTEAMGFELTAMTRYMFDEEIPLFTRFLSFFHFWLPIFLLWAVSRVGYDRRAFALWTILGAVDLLICGFWMPAPPPPADNKNLPVNINYVYGTSDEAPQQWMDPDVYFLLLFFGLPLLVFLPTHLALSWLMPRAGSSSPTARQRTAAP